MASDPTQTTVSMSETEPKPLLEGLPVAGYQPQTSRAVDAVNVNKAMEEAVLRRLDALTNQAADKHWLAVARTHIEQGFMAANRAVFQPGRIALAEDQPNRG